MSWLLANALVAAVLALVVLALGRSRLRPAPAVMHGLWLVVLLKLVTPPLFEVPVDLSLLDASPVARAEAAPTELAPTAIQPPAAAPLPTAPGRALPRITSADVVTVHEVAETAAAAPTPDDDRLTTTLLLAAWLGSAALLLVVATTRALRVRRRVRAFRAAGGKLRAEVAAIAARIGVRAPEVCDDPSAPAPYVWTLGRTRLVVPVAKLARCAPKAREAVLAHELAHLHRRDHWVARGEFVLGAFLWWHPLFWLARRQMRLWAELACDAVAVRTVPDAGLDYATLLVDAAAQPPSPTGPEAAVLAARPSVRAAFEERLKMILNDSQPRRASRAWCIPFAGLALGLFAAPVTATAQEPEPDPLRVEIRVNGKAVEGLSPAQRRALLEVLAERGQGRAERGQNRAQDPLKARRKAKPRGGELQLEGLPQASDLRAMITQGLDEARREIAADEDLKELGITDEVLSLLDGVARGEGIENSLDDVVRAAMRGAGKMAMKELADDPDLKRLGLTEGIGKLVEGFLGSERNQELVADFARNAIDEALKDAKRDLRQDADLQRLGITGDVERLIDAVVEGSPNGGFEHELEALIEKAAGAALREVQGELQRGGAGRAESRARSDRKGTGRKQTDRKEGVRDPIHELEAELEAAKQELERARRELRRLQERRRTGDGDDARTGTVRSVGDRRIAAAADPKISNFVQVLLDTF